VTPAAQAARARAFLHQQAGFADIRIMPESFLVRAKDRDGNPVMMVINPDSITAIERQPGGSTTGAGTQMR
jgi:hypothetical protein